MSFNAWLGVLLFSVDFALGLLLFTMIPRGFVAAKQCARATYKAGGADPKFSIPHVLPFLENCAGSMFSPCQMPCIAGPSTQASHGQHKSAQSRESSPRNRGNTKRPMGDKESQTAEKLRRPTNQTLQIFLTPACSSQETKVRQTYRTNDPKLFPEMFPGQLRNCS